MIIKKKTVKILRERNLCQYISSFIHDHLFYSMYVDMDIYIKEMSGYYIQTLNFSSDI